MLRARSKALDWAVDMANYETEAIVIGSKNFGDADKIVTLFTSARGKVKAMAYGARRPKNPLAASLQVFHRIEAELSEGKNLDIVRVASLNGRFPKITEDLDKMSYAMFVLEILAEVFPENTPEAEVYEFLAKVLKVFEKRNPRITANLAVWKILNFAGFAISLKDCPICNNEVGQSLSFSAKDGGFLCENCRKTDELKISQDAKNLLLNFIAFDWSKIDQGLTFSVQGDKLAEAEKVLIIFLQHILGFKPKSLRFIQNIK